MADVFISYSRANSAFAHKLAEELKKRQYEVWVDIAGIPFTSQWWTEIQRGIESADNFALVMSPESLGSPVCHLEIEYARKLNKRIIPIHHIGVTDEEAIARMQKRIEDDPYITELVGKRDPNMLFHNNWQVISSINWFTYPPSEDQSFYEKLPAFVEALQVDMAHVRQHTRLLTRSKDWLNNKKNPELLLLGNDVASAEKWLAEWEQDTAENAAKDQPPKSPKPTDEIRAFISASHKAEIERQRQLNELENSRERAEEAAQRSDAAARNARRILTGVALASAVILIGVVAFTSSQVATAVAQVATATVEQGRAQDQVATATVEIATAVALQANAEQSAATATVQQGQAEEDAAAARTEAAQAAGTATQIPPTLTQARIVVEDALIEQEISVEFADAVLQSDNPVQIIFRMDRVVEVYPEEASAYVVRGVAYDRLGETDLAIEDFTRAIELEPQNPAPYLNRGGTYYDMGEYDRAIEDFDTAIAFNPEYFLLHYNRGLVNQARGELEQAIADYDLAIELAPGLDQAYNNRGLIYADMGDYEQAIADYNESITINPVQTDAYNNRASAYRSIGEYDLALSDHAEAIGLDPNNPQLYINRAITYDEWYEYELAIEDLNTVVSLTPDDPLPYLIRATLYYYNNEPALTLADFEQYEALGGELSDEDQAIRDEVAEMVEQTSQPSP